MTLAADNIRLTQTFAGLKKQTSRSNSKVRDESAPSPTTSLLLNTVFKSLTVIPARCPGMTVLCTVRAVKARASVSSPQICSRLQSLSEKVEETRGALRGADTKRDALVNLSSPLHLLRGAAGRQLICSRQTASRRSSLPNLSADERGFLSFWSKPLSESVILCGSE